MLLPLDNSTSLNFLNFSSLGSNTLKGAEAFSKVRNFSKTHNTNITYTPLSSTATHSALHSLYFNENNFLDTLSYGLKRQHSLLSSTSTTNSGFTAFDTLGVDHYKSYSLGSSSTQYQLSGVQPKNFFHKSQPFLQLKEFSKAYSPLSHFFQPVTNVTLSKFLTFPHIVSEINNDSDKTPVNFPVFKLLNLNANTEHSYN